MLTTKQILSSLQKIAPPPSRPVCVGTTVLWDSLQNRCGIQLPDDFISLVNIYGACGFTDYFVLLNPFINNNGINMFAVQSLYRKTYLQDDGKGSKIHGITNVYKKYRREIERDELLPSISTSNGDQFFWVTSEKNNPNKWKTLAVGRGGDRIDEIGVPVSEMLVEIFTSRRAISFMPNDGWNASKVIRTISAKDTGSFKGLKIFPLDTVNGLPKNYVSLIKDKSAEDFI